MRMDKVVCDGCGADLTEEGRLELRPESRLRVNLNVSSKPPPLDRIYHFCDLNCIDSWRTEPMK